MAAGSTLWLSLAGPIARASAVATACVNPPSPVREPRATRDELADELRAFLAELTAWRSGDAAAGPRLRASAVRLRALGRPDAADVAETYLALDTDQLAQGLADEARFHELRRRVVDADAEDWPALRAALLLDLDAAADAWADHADRAPRARVLALAARLRADRAQADPTLDPDARRRLAERAAAEAELALDLFARAGQRTPRLEPLWVLGEARRAAGDPHAAARAYERAAELADALGRDEWCVRAGLGSLALAREAGDVAAVDRLLASLAARRDPREHWPLAREHALRLLHEDRGEACVRFLEELAPDAPREAREHAELLAAALVRDGRDAEALEALARLDPAAADGEAGRLVRAGLELARGRAREVLAALPAEAFATEAGRAQAASLRGAAWLRLDEPARAEAELAESLELARAWQATRALDPAGEADLQGGTLQGGSVQGEWLGVQALVWYARALLAQGDALGAAVALEHHQARDLRDPSGDPRALGTGLDEHALATWARRGAGMLVWVVGADDGLVVHVDASGDALGLDLPVGRRAVQRAVRRLREAARAGDVERARALGRELADVLLPGPVHARVLAARDADGEGGDPAPDLLVLPHGPLEALPLALLELEVAPGVSRALDALVTVRVLPGLPDGPDATDAPGERADPGPGWALLGAPHLDGADAPHLPGAARELAHLARLHPDAPLRTGAAFTREALRAELRGARDLHLATHLWADPTCGARAFAPDGLLCSDGVLCSEELRTLAAPRDLVVLSACATGDGRAVDGEGLMGLGRAFLASGTRDVLVTLWPVEDRLGERFALAFHRARAAGAAPSAAARRARHELVEAGEPPTAVAAFRLLGRD